VFALLCPDWAGLQILQALPPRVGGGTELLSFRLPFVQQRIKEVDNGEQLTIGAPCGPSAVRFATHNDCDRSASETLVGTITNS
jgi:hypothetical protein